MTHSRHLPHDRDVGRTAKSSTKGEVMKVVVIGGTGVIDSKVVSKLTQRGHEALAAAPNTGVNTSLDGYLYYVAQHEVGAFDFASGRCIGAVMRFPWLHGQEREFSP